MNKYKSVNVKGFKHLYEVSESGDVYSLKSKKCLKQRIRNGYKTVYLYNGVTKKTKTAAVSRLIALTYIDNPNKYKIVNHISGDKMDNCVENLEWMTQKQNVKHALDNNLTKISTRKVMKYDKNFQYIKTFNSIKEASIDIGLTRHGIIRVCKGKNKTAGGFIWKYVNADIVTDTSCMKKIKGYEYLAGENGDIYSNISKKILKPITNESGYQYVTLCKKGKKKRNYYIHVLVAKTYIPNPKNKTEVNHKNRIKSDNSVSNLEWMTHSENVKHYYSTISPQSQVDEETH